MAATCSSSAARGGCHVVARSIPAAHAAADDATPCRRRRRTPTVPAARAHSYDLGAREFATLEEHTVMVVGFNPRTQAEETVTLTLDASPDLACLRACTVLQQRGVHDDLASIITLALAGHYTTTNTRLNFANPLFVEDVRRACDYIASAVPAPAFTRFQFLVVYDMSVPGEGDTTTRADALVLAPMDAPCTMTSSDAICAVGATLAQVTFCRTHVLWTYRNFLERAVARMRDARIATPPKSPLLKPNARCPCTSGQKFKNCCGRRL